MRNPVIVTAVPGILTALLAVACGASSSATGDDGTSGNGAANSFNPNGNSAAGSGSSAAGGGAGSTATGGVTSTTTNDVCSGKSPVVSVADPGNSTSYQTCTGSIAETRFVNALCTCHDATMGGYLRTRSFDSAVGTTLELGGSVGVNNKYNISTGYTDVGGSFTIAGSDSLSFAGYLKTGVDFRAQGSTTVAGYTNVGRDLWLAAGMTDLGPINVGRDLHATGPVIGIPTLVKGTTTQASGTIAPPCPCEDKDILDVPGLIAQAKAKNDNATTGLTPDMFNVVIGNMQATLSCGKYYIEQIAGIGNLIFNVQGRVALFVDGSIASTGNLEFKLDPGAEIDIFVRENLVLTGHAAFGDKARPAASRIYVGSAGDIILTGYDEFVGNLYAPKSLVQAVGFIDVYGSIVARDFVCPGYASFGYDAAISRAGDTCEKVDPPPPGKCDKCGSCTGGTACVDGKCGSCHADSDCCSQLVCNGGKCVQPTPVIVN